MCGINWYREQMEMADDDIMRLNQLLQMMEERYRLSPIGPNELETQINPAVIAIYREIICRKNSLLTSKSPQA